MSKLDWCLYRELCRRAEHCRPDADVDPSIEVCLRFAGDVAALQSLGFVLASSYGDTAIGAIRLSALERFAAHEQIESVRAAPRLRPALDKSVSAINVPVVWSGVPGYKGRGVIDCNTLMRKGDELGWFEHGSTIIVFAPHGFALHEGIRDGAAIRMGEPLLRLP